MELKNGLNLKLDIAIGKSRFTEKWKNTQITWPELVNKLSKTHRTHETFKEFLAMKKADQDQIKDVGGFVGGQLKEGRRKNGYVVSRSIITLDVDNANEDFWDDVKLIATYAMCVYSTHKHTRKSPRLRLVIPLSRNVSSEEYEAIARKIADEYGMDLFDDTTYEPCRLMYWPSSPKDTEYFFDVIDAPILNPDTVLAQYPDWKDTSYWPESSRVQTARRKSADKQGDPTEKEGLIGAFCRTYSIQDAISLFLNDIYSECNDGRYTYVHGSTSGGLVIYDDKFAYSHHSTDPISGKLCNAFDLVRIHKYGELDDSAKEDTPVTRMPSYLKMMDFIASDENVRVTLGEERLEVAKQEFGVIDDDSDHDWLKKLDTNKKGEIEATIDNMLLIMENDPNLKGIGGRNLFTDKFEVTHKLPWKREGRYWTDLDDASLRHYMETVYKLEGRQKLIDALAMVFEKNAFHPIKQYIESVKWDGKPRVETLLIDYLGAEDSLYVRTVTRKALVAAVARIYNPGCKFDYMLTLVGNQGIGKSLLVAKLGGEWFSDTLPDLKGKESYEALDGVWLMEMGELAALRKADREAIKSYIAKTEDSYRKAYARNVSVNKRKCIFIGTTNEREFLSDPTGNRRFWVVECDELMSTKTVWDDLTDDEINQIWAEAYYYFRQGENIMQLPREVNIEATVKQKQHTEVNSFMPLVEDYLKKPIPKNWYQMSFAEQESWTSSVIDFNLENGNSDLVQRNKVCAIEIWCFGLGGNKTNFTNAIARKINECMDQLDDWEQVRGRFGSYGIQRGYRRRFESIINVDKVEN